MGISILRRRSGVALLLVVLGVGGFSAYSLYRRHSLERDAKLEFNARCLSNGVLATTCKKMLADHHLACFGEATQAVGFASIQLEIEMPAYLTCVAVGIDLFRADKSLHNSAPK